MREAVSCNRLCARAHVSTAGTPIIAGDQQAFLSNAGLAKLGFLYLRGGQWEGQQIVSREWVKESLSPFTAAGEHYKYGFKWWLLPRTDRPGVVWMARGFGGQRLMVFPEEEMIAVFTGCEILKDEAQDRDLVDRILPALRTVALPQLSFLNHNVSERPHNKFRSPLQLRPVPQFPGSDRRAHSSG